MPIHLTRETRDAIGSDAKDCNSRSLYFNRFADPTLEKEERKKWFIRGINIPVPKEVQSDRTHHFPGTTFLHARLMSRLMVNMAGGVMENAGLSLDRYGLPIIPGSAVKGCARRAALAALREWCETGTKPEGNENLFTRLCESSQTPADLLTTIAKVFGWVETDWSNPKANPSDFHWACNGDAAIVQSARTQLHSSKQFAGSIAFLHASPNRDPGLVLDVVTPHHTAYYESKNPNAIATDTEEPVPVLFPAVKEQGENDHFTFPLIPLRNADVSLLTFAQEALRTGLEVFGIGAKTNAGYGWFDASEDLNTRIAERQKEAIERKRQLELQAAEKARLDAEAKARAEAKTALAAALEGLTPEQQEDKKLELLSTSQFDAKVRAFCKEPKKGGPSETEKQAIVRALRGPRLDYWQTFKTKATKGDLATADQAIRQLSKTLNLGKMP